MEKLTQKEIEEEGKKVQEEYVYLMVDMLLENWIWEFIRRSDKYRTFHDKAIELRSIFMKGIHAGKNHWDKMAEFLNEGLEYFEPEFPFNFMTIDHFEVTPSKHMIQVDDSLSREGYITIWVRNVADKEWNHISIPSPDRKHSEFHSVSPRLNGTLPYKLLDERAHKLFIPEGIAAMIDLPVFRKEQEGADVDAIHIAISNKIQSKDIDSILLKALREELTNPLTFPLKPAKKRDDKWKYYLIIYDLKKRYGNSVGYKELSDILHGAYPDILRKSRKQTDQEEIDETTAREYYSAALKLINGYYKKHLYF